MAVDLSLNGIIDIVAWAFFGGSASLAGLAIMLVFMFAAVALLAAFKAPITYALVPVMIIALFFTSMGVLDTTISFLIIILCAVIIASQARNLTGGR